MIKKIKRFTLIKLGDVTFESGRVFFWALVSDRGDLKNTKFTICGEIFSVIFVEAYDFSDLSVCADGIEMIGSRVFGWCKWIFVVERIKI